MNTPVERDRGRGRPCVEHFTAATELAERAGQQAALVWAVVGIAQGLAQIGERLAQVLPGAGVGLVGPKEGGQAFAAVRALALDGQIGQQGAGFVGGKIGDGTAV